MTFTKWGCVSGLVLCVVRPTGCSARVAERYKRAEEAVNTLPATAVSGGRAGCLYVAGGGCFRAGVGRMYVAGGSGHARVGCTLREVSEVGPAPARLRTRRRRWCPGEQAVRVVRVVKAAGRRAIVVRIYK